MVSFTITLQTDHTGAEVIDVDFARPIASETRITLNRGSIDHVVVMHVNERRYLYRRMFKGEIRA